MRTADPSIIHRDRARPLCCLLPVRAPHLLDRYGRTPPLADRVPVPCPRAGGLREMGARARRAGAVAARHVPFPPSRAGPPRPLQVAPLQLCPRPVSSAYAYAALPSSPMAPKPGPVHARGAVPIPIPNPNPAQRCAGSPARPAWPSLSHALVAVAGIPLPAVGFCATGSARRGGCALPSSFHLFVTTRIDDIGTCLRGRPPGCAN